MYAVNCVSVMRSSDIYNWLGLRQTLTKLMLLSPAGISMYWSIHDDKMQYIYSHNHFYMYINMAPYYHIVRKISYNLTDYIYIYTYMYMCACICITSNHAYWRWMMDGRGQCIPRVRISIISKFTDLYFLEKRNIFQCFMNVFSTAKSKHSFIYMKTNKASNSYFNFMQIL